MAREIQRDDKIIHDGKGKKTKVKKTHYKRN